MCLAPGDAESDAARPARARILEAAANTFAEQGLDKTSLRSITAAADVNIAAVNYYFGSKEELVHAVLDDLARRINQRRIRQLDAAFERARETGGLPALEEVLTIFIAPYVRPESRQEGDLLIKLILLHRSAPNDVTRRITTEHFNPLTERFIEALAEILPGYDRVDLAWRYFFMVGSVLFGISETGSGGRIGSVTGGRAATEDVDALVRQLTAFLTGGLTAPPVEHHT